MYVLTLNICMTQTLKNLTFYSLILLLLLLPSALHGQVAINLDGSNPAASAMLDVTSTTKGILIPRMTEAQRDLISTPVAGLMIYQTNNTPGFYYHDGSSWSAVSGGGGSSVSRQIITGTTTLTGTNDHAVVLTGASAYTVTLPASPANGQIIYLGNANSNTTLSFTGKDIVTKAGSAATNSFALSNTGSLILIYDGTNWFALASSS